MKYIREYENSLIRETAALNNVLNHSDMGTRLLAWYLHKTWSKEDICRPTQGMDVLPLLRNVVSIQGKTESYSPLKGKRKRSNDEEETTIDSGSLDPIVYFNVEGEIFPILRSTILRVIPNSQLAVRVSGRWEEQAEKGDIDEEGDYQCSTNDLLWGRLSRVSELVMSECH
jgi:hypothetical protein